MDLNRELLAELLLCWEELYEQGQDISASTLAKEHPELIDELARRIQHLKAISWIDTPIDDEYPDDVYIGDLCKPKESYPLAPRTLAKRYRLGELIAEGGFAKVFKGFDSELERIVAIKVPKASKVESRDSFQAEAKRVAGLKHEGIVPVFDVGLEGDTCFIVTEFVEGGSLAEKLWSPNIKVADAVGWTAAIGDALEYAHSRGVIHLDIKPANILLNNRGRARLTDFGISRSAATAEDLAPSLGTLQYMSPEQLEGKPTDHRSDIYSLAVVLFEAINGETPHSSSEPHLLRKEIVLGQKPSWTNDCPLALRQAVEKALSRDPDQRQSSAGEFTAEIRRASSPRPRRSAWPWAVASVVALALYAGRYLGGKQEGDPPTVSLTEVMAEATTDLLDKRYEEAERGFTQVLKADPSNAEALKSRGNTRLNLKMLDEAVADLTKAADLAPDDPMTLKYRGLAYAELRDFPRAIADYTAVVRLLPEAREFQEELASVYAIRSHDRFENGQFALAADDMTEAIRLAPESPVNYHRRGACWFHMGEYQKAYDDLTVAIDKEPSKPDHYDNRGQTLERMGRSDDAEKDFRKARELRGQ